MSEVINDGLLHIHMAYRSRLKFYILLALPIYGVDRIGLTCNALALAVVCGVKGGVVWQRRKQHVQFMAEPKFSSSSPSTIPGDSLPSPPSETLCDIIAPSRARIMEQNVGSGGASFPKGVPGSDDV